MAVLTGLHRFTNYSIQVLAFTRVGDGVTTKPIICTTEEDGTDWITLMQHCTLAVKWDSFLSFIIYKCVIKYPILLHWWTACSLGLNRSYTVVISNVLQYYIFYTTYGINLCSLPYTHDLCCYHQTSYMCI